MEQSFEGSGSLHSYQHHSLHDPAPIKGSEEDWFSPAKQYADESHGPIDVHNNTQDVSPETVRHSVHSAAAHSHRHSGDSTRRSSIGPDGHRNSTGKKSSRTHSSAVKSKFGQLTDTDTGPKELGVTQDALEAEMRILQKQSEDLTDEIFRMHISLLQLGDPTEAPFPRTELIKDVWVVEGHQGMGEPGIEFTSKADQGVQVLNVDGKDTQTPITINGCVKRLEVENCKHVRLVVEAVLFEIVLTHCTDVLLVVGGEPPDVVVLSSSAVALLICHKMCDGKIRCKDSGGVMVSTVDRGTNPVMLPEHILQAENLLSAEVPAYFVTTSSYRTWTTQVTAHPALE